MVGRVGGASWPPRAAGSSSTPSTSSTATAADPGYALEVLAAAAGAGADTLVLCDTNGGTLPDDGGPDRAPTVAAASPAGLGVHFHNDAACAVANSLLAVGRRRGARPGRGQRVRRAVRQRRPVLGHRQPGAQARARAAAAGTARRAGRAPPGGSPSWPTCRSTARQPYVGLVGVRHQGGAARLGHRPAPGRVLARRPGAGRQPAAGAGQRAGRAEQRAGQGRPSWAWTWPASPTWPGRSWTGSRRPSTAATRSRPRTPRSSCWSGASPGSCRPGSAWRATGS